MSVYSGAVTAVRSINLSRISTPAFQRRIPQRIRVHLSVFAARIINHFLFSDSFPLSTSSFTFHRRRLAKRGAKIPCDFTSLFFTSVICKRLRENKGGERREAYDTRVCMSRPTPNGAMLIYARMHAEMKIDAVGTLK